MSFIYNTDIVGPDQDVKDLVEAIVEQNALIIETNHLVIQTLLVNPMVKISREEVKK